MAVPGLPREEMIGIREMIKLREMLRRAREKGLAELTISDLKELIVQVIRVTGLISAATAAIGIITDLITIADAAREAIKDRTIDLSGAKSRVRVSFQKPRLRMKSAGMRKSAEQIRRRISALKKTSSTKRMRQL